MTAHPLPTRVQLSRTKGWRMPPNTAKVDRSTRFGNPFRPVLVDAETCVRNFREWLTTEGEGRFGMSFEAAVMRERLHGIRGKNLACWCKPGAPCHADVLLELANK